MRQNPLIVRTNCFEISDAIEAKSALVTKCLGLDKNSSLRHFSRIMQVRFSILGFFMKSRKSCPIHLCFVDDTLTASACRDIATAFDPPHIDELLTTF